MSFELRRTRNKKFRIDQARRIFTFETNVRVELSALLFPSFPPPYFRFFKLCWLFFITLYDI